MKRWIKYIFRIFVRRKQIDRQPLTDKEHFEMLIKEKIPFGMGEY